jgi:hypothetical protein
LRRDVTDHRRILVAFALAAFAAVAMAAGPDDPTEALVWEAVGTDCAVDAGDGRRLIVALRARTGAEEMLASLLVDGPGVDRMAAQAQHLEERWERRQEFLAGDPRTGLPPDLLLAVAAETREEYVAAHLARFDAAIRERAAAALAALGTASARQALDQTRSGADDELRATIDRALEQFPQDAGTGGAWRRMPRPRGGASASSKPGR